MWLALQRNVPEPVSFPVHPVLLERRLMQLVANLKGHLLFACLPFSGSELPTAICCSYGGNEGVTKYETNTARHDVRTRHVRSVNLPSSPFSSIAAALFLLPVHAKRSCQASCANLFFNDAPQLHLHDTRWFQWSCTKFRRKHQDNK